MKYSVVIFDMDGTTLYTLEDLTDGVNYALEKNGLPSKKLEEVRTYVGNGIHSEIEHSVPENTKEEVMERVYQDFVEWYGIHCNDHTHPYEGILELMDALNEAGCKCAIVSNKGDSAVQQLDEIYFRNRIACGVGEKKNVRRKPCPDSVWEVLKQLDIPKEKAVYVGDSEVDIETATNAGMDGIFVSYGYRTRAFLEAHGAATIVDSVQELKEVLFR